MTRFKVSILILITLFATSSIFISCSTNPNDLGLVNNDTQQLKVFLNQSYYTSKSNVEVLDAKNKIQSSNVLLAKDNGSNDGSFYMQMDFKSEDGIVEFNSVTTEITSDGTNEFFTTYTEFSNESGYTAMYKIMVEKLNDDEYESADYNILSFNGEKFSVANKCWSDYGNCIGGVLDTDESLGQVITVSGIAGGAGCVPCGIAGGGVIFGFAALGCTAV